MQATSLWTSKKLPSTTPPSAAKYANTLYNTQNKNEKEKKRGKKKKTSKNEEAKELVRSVSNARRQRISNTFWWKEEELLRVAQEHQHGKEREREREGGSRERLSIGRETKTTGNGRL